MSDYDALSPVRRIPTDPREDHPEPGIALCLSGGGYRAMLFHLGVLWRLNDAGYLPRLTRISSVSAGSITAGVLALSWPRLALRDGVAQRFGPQVVVPVRRLAGVTVDLWAVVHGVLWRSARTIWLTGEFAPMSRPTPNADSVMGRVSL